MNELKCKIVGSMAIGLITGVLMVLAHDVFAQDLTAERTKVLRVIGTSKVVDTPLFPVDGGKGLVFQHEIMEPDTNSLRIHFQVERAGNDWSVLVLDESGDVAWTTSDCKVSGMDFWTDEIAGGKLTVKVYSAQPSSSLQLKIHKIALIKPEVAPVSITGVNQLTSIIGQDNWISKFGESVARLRFVGDDGGIYVCTTFLVTSDLMLTNQHCISNENEMKSALVDFDYLKEDEIGQTLQFNELLATDFDLDYAVVRLSQRVDRNALNLQPTHPDDGAQLLIIQHPAGEPQQVSIADCTVDGALEKGRGQTYTDLGHQCDTKGGSSGSPVFEFSSQKVVGLHHLGINPASGDFFNRAVHINLILEDLTPLVRQEIEQN